MAKARVSVANVVAGADDQPEVTHPVSATEADTPRVWVVAASVGTVAAISIAAWICFEVFDPKPIRVTSTYVPLAGFIIVATALERFLQPLSLYFLSTDDAVDPDDKATAAAAAGADPTASVKDVQTKVNAAAKAKAVLGRRKEERAVVYWAIASSLAMLIAGGFGFLLITSVASITTPVNRFFDIAVTGLAIGAGTKPLHDLFTNIQAKAAKSSSG